MQRINIIDSHTGGEPTRLVIDGFPDTGPGDMARRRTRMAKEFDHWRRATMLEPRGHDVLVGALLCPPTDPAAVAGVVFFNNTGYLGMCGHGTIGVIASLAWLGRIQAGQHCIETPVGPVYATLHEDGSVSVRNVRSWRLRKNAVVDVPGHGRVQGDIAWGGNWFFLVDAPERVTPGASTSELTDFAWSICQALDQQGIHGQDGALIDHIELFGPDQDADSRSFVLCPGKAYDRSPCGTGTSAKIACLAADGKLAPGQIWRQASIIGSQFSASYEIDPDGGVIPTITGRAHISGENTLILQEDDPFCMGHTGTTMTTKQPATRIRATEAAYDAIEQMIATLQLEPNQPIVESELIQMTGLGRTPIREALMRLVARGLIEQQPRRGLRVSEIRIAEHLILIETRRVLERLIAAASTRRATPDQRTRLLQHAQDMLSAAANNDIAGYMQADQALDRVNHEASRNPYAVQAIIPMIIQCRRFWYAYQHEGDLDRGARCHLMLAEGIHAGDQERATAGANALMDYLMEFTHTVIEG